MLPSEQYNWSEGVYNDLVQRVKAELQSISFSAERYVFCYLLLLEALLIYYSIPVVPTSLQGENFIERSPKLPWYTGTTLVEALDNVFS